MYTSYHVRESHRIGISLAGADAKHFHSSVPPGGRTVTVHCGPAHPSMLQLPVYRPAQQ